jgi:hypothetical protein
MSYYIEVYDSIYHVPPLWDEQFSFEHPMYSGKLSVTELAAVNHVKVFYVITFSNHKPILFSYFQQLLVTPSHFNCKDSFFQHVSLNIYLNLVKPTLLVAGNLFRHDAYYLHAVKTEDVSSVYWETCQYVMNYTRSTGIFIKDAPSEIAKYLSQQQELLPMPNDISMVMNISKNWQSLDDYAKQLKRKYKKRYKKVIAHRDDIEIKCLSVEDIIAQSNMIESLYMQVTNNQLVSMGKLNAAFFIEMKKSLQDNYVVYGWYVEGKLVAFSSAILHKDVYDMNYIGFDYSVNQTHQLYFNILFHCLEEAIVRSCKKVILGRTALEAKAMLGCEPDYKYSFYQLRHPLVNWFYKKISTRFHNQLGEQWKERKPFKANLKQEKAAENNPIKGLHIS